MVKHQVRAGKIAGGMRGAVGVQSGWGSFNLLISHLEDEVNSVLIVWAMDAALGGDAAIRRAEEGEGSVRTPFC